MIMIIGNLGCPLTRAEVNIIASGSVGSEDLEEVGCLGSAWSTQCRDAGTWVHQEALQ